MSFLGMKVFRAAEHAQRWACSNGDRRLRKALPLPDGKAVRLPEGSPPSVQNEVATRGVRALVRSGIRSSGERSLPDAPVQLGAKAPCTEALALRGAAGWYLPAARMKGSMRGGSRWVLEVLDALTVVLADGTRLQESVSDVRVVRPEVMSLGLSVKDCVPL